MDLTPAYIAHARAGQPDPRIGYQVGDACAPSFADRSFDRVLALLLLHIVPSASVAMAEMRRVAKPGRALASGTGPPRSSMRSRSRIGAFILIGLGVLFLLSNFGLLPNLGSLFARWWPLILIAVGAGLLLRR